MFSIVSVSWLLVFLFLVELLYFKIADHYNIIDKPNSRSSHTEITIRGGGILFPIGALTFLILHEFQHPYFIAGLVVISLISFLDDILTLNNKIRLLLHLFSVVLMIVEWGLNGFPWFLFPLLIIVVIGVINAYNFMDGINGITGMYSLVAVGTLMYINRTVPFTNAELLVFTCLSILVFGIFNFRKKAKCFAGDVGSVSMAFILTFLIGKLIVYTHNWTYILLLLIYGLDAAITIFFRLIRRESIYEAHRSHFYQYLANERKISHLLISAGYATCQLGINILVVKYPSIPVVGLMIVVFLSAVNFIALRWFLEGKDRLLKSN